MPPRIIRSTSRTRVTSSPSAQRRTEEDSETGIAQGRELLAQITTLNGAALPAEKRLGLLQGAERNASGLLAHLRALYANAPQPLEREAREALDLACQLALAFSRGYRKVATDAA